MKKLVYLIIVMLVLGLIVTGCSLLVPPVEKDETSMLTKAKPGTDFSGAHYNLNIIGKKSDWNGGGSYDNPDRHTMFVPENTDEFEITPGNTCFTPNDDPRLDEPGVTIWMTQGDEFAVLDGNAFDDCKCEFQLGPDRYKVYIVAKGKPGGETDITGWVRYPDPNEDYAVYYYLYIGSVNVKKTKDWNDATDIFYVSCSEDLLSIVDDIVDCDGLGMWVFEYLSALTTYDPLINDNAYFWQFDNNGNKLVQVRFYPD
jgi:hypothetical protein